MRHQVPCPWQRTRRLRFSGLAVLTGHAEGESCGRNFAGDRIGNYSAIFAYRPRCLVLHPVWMKEDSVIEGSTG
jgi:hypothetical protein